MDSVSGHTLLDVRDDGKRLSVKKLGFKVGVIRASSTTSFDFVPPTFVLLRPVKKTNLGFQRGRHTWKFRIIRKGASHGRWMGIGIASDHRLFAMPSHILRFPSQSFGTSFNKSKPLSNSGKDTSPPNNSVVLTMFANGDIVTHKNGLRIGKPVKGKNKFNDGDTINVILDFDKNKVFWSKDRLSKVIGSCELVESCKAYYPMVMFSSEKRGTSVELIS